MKFDGAGKLVDPEDDFDITFDALSNGATIGSDGVVTWDIKGSSITGYASTSVIRSLSNDGYASGLLKSLSIDGDGKINGFFTNGQTSDIAQFVLADFENPWGLKKWARTSSERPSRRGRRSRTPRCVGDGGGQIQLPRDV